MLHLNTIEVTYLGNKLGDYTRFRTTSLGFLKRSLSSLGLYSGLYLGKRLCFQGEFAKLVSAAAPVSFSSKLILRDPGCPVQRRQQQVQPWGKEMPGMNTPEAALGRKASGAMWTQGPWLHSQRWDLLYITGSSGLVVLPLVLYAVMGHSATFVNLFIAGVIGGPHMYATFFRTFLDASFWQRHRLLVGCSLGIPVLVVAGALWNFQLLITLFFFWLRSMCCTRSPIFWNAMNASSMAICSAGPGALITP